MPESTNLAQSRPAPRVINVTVPITMTSREAEQVQWQDTGGKFSHLKGTLGELLASKVIYPSHLAYMVDRGETPLLREACRVLLLRWLEAAPATGASVRRGPEVVTGSNYATDQREESLAMAMAYATGAVFVSLFLTFGLVQSALGLINKGTPWPLAAFGLLFWMVVLGVPLGLWLYRSIRGNLRRYRDFYRGQEAEEWFVDRLRANLDSRWTIYRNLQLPGKKSDLDVVLVGPAGVWVFEVKGYKPPVRFHDERWEIQVGKKWKPLDGNPLRQAAFGAAQLHEFLARHNITRYIDKAVIFSEPQVADNFADHREEVWLRFEADEKIAALLPNASGPVNQEERHNINSELQRVAQMNGIVGR